MATVVKVNHTGFTVRSLERSLAFYSDLLGLEVVFRWNPQEPYIGELVGYPNVDLHGAVLRVPGSDALLELLEYRGIESATVDMANGNVGNGHIAFTVDELGPLYERLRQAGVRSVSEPVTPTIGPDRGGRVVYMIDPDGFRVELVESRGSFGSANTETART